jgi:hypothetical protein
MIMFKILSINWFIVQVCGVVKLAVLSGEKKKKPKKKKKIEISE